MPPEGKARRVYAIGDIHGCAGKLVALHAAVVEDLVGFPVAEALLVHLGDYVDRGPDSAGVLELAAKAPVPGLAVVNLLGNHERTMLEALDGNGAAATDWMYNGGGATLQSWGIDPASPRDRWPHAVPEAHLAFLRGLVLSHRRDGYLFVHAGIRPGVPLERQVPEDLLSIREPFLSSEAAFPAIVVHGHSPSRAPVVKANRIGIDTGAVFGGKLTCAVLEGGSVRFLQA